MVILSIGAQETLVQYHEQEDSLQWVVVQTIIR